MRIAICDDELLAARQLERIVKKILERETGGVGVASGEAGKGTVNAMKCCGKLEKNRRPMMKHRKIPGCGSLLPARRCFGKSKILTSCFWIFGCPRWTGLTWEKRS